jgi:hypothetical protein
VAQGLDPPPGQQPACCAVTPPLAFTLTRPPAAARHPWQHVEVSKLVKARPLDNMEFMQWLKTYFDQHTGGQGVHDYEPAARRALCKTGDARGPGGGGGSVAPAPAAAAPLPPAPRAAAGALGGAAAGAGAGSGYAVRSSGAGAPPKRAPSAKLSAGGAPAAPAGAGIRAQGARSRGASNDGAVEQLTAELATWHAAADTATKEKDFYVRPSRPRGLAGEGESKGGRVQRTPWAAAVSQTAAHQAAGPPQLPA